MTSALTEDCVAQPSSPCADAGARRLSRPLALIFAAACGISVANVYYAQPLLDAIAESVAIDPASIGLVVTLTQLGYAIGLVAIVPLGDRLDRRRLILGQVGLSVPALIVVASAPTPAVLLVGMVALGLLSVVVQVLVAFAATLAAPAERGRAIGLVTSGVVIGILASRVAAGAIADLAGWRMVYGVSAVLMLVMTGILWRVLPREGRRMPDESYAAILRSIPVLFAEQPLLRMRALLALLIFAAFSTFWTSLVLPLSAAPHAFPHGVIGLFGLVGLVGALAARGAGRLADQGLGPATTGAALLLLLASWGLIALLPVSLAALLVGVLMLDLAVQAVHVTNQSLIVARFPDSHSRLIGGYMVFYSLGSGLGALASTIAYAHAGWAGVALLGAGFSGTALALWACTRWRPKTPRRRRSPGQGAPQ
ncbi:MFS transporter [Methylobacterium sp. ID0610]|uniref:MFS transporter n=1 Tax=Methylobacterium carpenticola TaxID=3344827 RepID=UPI0036831191